MLGLLVQPKKIAGFCKPYPQKSVSQRWGSWVAVIFAVLMVFAPLQVKANTSQVLAYPEFSQGSLVGEGRFTYLFWNLYDAKLYAPTGEWNPQGAYALALHYLRSLDGEKIAERSIDEMKAQGLKNPQKIEAWLKQMTAIFPDVAAGTTLIGIRTVNGTTVFYQDQTRIGEVLDVEFSDWFFGIWLKENTSAPALRQKLLNLEQGSKLANGLMISVSAD